MLTPLLVFIIISLIYGVQLLENKKVSPRWRAIATFSFFFGLVYAGFAFIFLRQISHYVAAG